MACACSPLIGGALSACAAVLANAEPQAAKQVRNRTIVRLIIVLSLLAAWKPSQANLENASYPTVTDQFFNVCNLLRTVYSVAGLIQPLHNLASKALRRNVGEI